MALRPSGGGRPSGRAWPRANSASCFCYAHACADPACVGIGHVSAKRVLARTGLRFRRRCIARRLYGADVRGDTRTRPIRRLSTHWLEHFTGSPCGRDRRNHRDEGDRRESLFIAWAGAMRWSRWALAAGEAFAPSLESVRERV